MVNLHEPCVVEDCWCVGFGILFLPKPDICHVMSIPLMYFLVSLSLFEKLLVVRVYARALTAGDQCYFATQQAFAALVTAARFSWNHCSAYDFYIWGTVWLIVLSRTVYWRNRCYCDSSK